MSLVGQSKTFLLVYLNKRLHGSKLRGCNEWWALMCSGASTQMHEEKKTAFIKKNQLTTCSAAAGHLS